MDDLVFRALADPHRRRLLDRLNQRNGQTLWELSQDMAMARQSVSKHLAILEAANLVSTQRHGREKLHFLNPVPINAIAERWMTQYDRARTAALSELTHALENQLMDTRFVYTTYIRTSPERLWTALTDPAFTRRYWGVELVSDWQVGSTITWHVGERPVRIADERQVVLVSDPPRRLSYTWHSITPEFLAVYGDAQSGFDARAAAEGRSKVTFEIDASGADMVKLTVVHDDFEPGSVILEGISQGWPPLIASLKTLLETGEPLLTAVG